jgi:hypothetical protein
MNPALLGFAASRVAYAVAVAVAPSRAAGVWLGKEVESGGTRVAARALVARDAYLAVGLADAARRGGATRPWLAALIASDLSDIAATLADRKRLPKQAGPGTVIVAGSAAAMGAALFAAAEK